MSKILNLRIEKTDNARYIVDDKSGEPSSIQKFVGVKANTTSYVFANSKELLDWLDKM